MTVKFQKPQVGEARKFKFSDHDPVSETINLENRYRDTGMAREYIGENITNMLAAPLTGELLKYGQMYSYKGHTFFKDGFFSDKSEPIGCCLEIEYEWPWIKHTEAFFDTEHGRVGESLYDTGSWGYSWATGGKDGGAWEPTKLDFIQGFDLVPIESFVSEEKRKAIGEQLALRNFDDDRIEQIAESLISNNQYASDTTSDALYDSQSRANRLQLENEILKNNTPNQDDALQFIAESFKNCPFNVPEYILKAFVNIDNPDNKAKIGEFFTNVANIDISSLPQRTKRSRTIVKEPGKKGEQISQIEMTFDAMPHLG